MNIKMNPVQLTVIVAKKIDLLMQHHNETQ